MKLQNNTAVLRSEIKTQADLDTMAKVAEYQGFDMSCQERLCLSDYASELIYVDDECNCLMYNPPINKILKIISLAEFLSYGKPEAVMSAPVPNIESFEWGGKTDEQLDVAMERVKELRAPEQSWHEKGELPPAGIKCLVKLNEKWVEAFIIGMSEGHCIGGKE